MTYGVIYRERDSIGGHLLFLQIMLSLLSRIISETIGYIVFILHTHIH